MSRGFQTVIAVGHLGDDPVFKTTQAGGSVAEFRIAVTKVYRNRQTGEQVEHTEWLRCKAFGRNAEIARDYLARGRLVGIDGELHTEKWQASDGSDRYSQWIYIDPTGLNLLGSREHAGTSHEHQGRARDQARPSTHLSPPFRNSVPEIEKPDDFADDDIPF